MYFIKNRPSRVTNYRGNDFDHRRYREVAAERCGLCNDIYPASMMLDNDGLRRCPDCYDVRGTYAKSEIEAHDNRQVAEKQTRPQISRMPLQSTTPPWIRTMTDASGNVVNQSSPLRIVRSGAAVQLLLMGGGFLSTDTFSYSTGISDSVAPSLSGSTQWTLTLVASGATAAGLNNITFNNHTYRGILKAG